MDEFSIQYISDYTDTVRNVFLQVYRMKVAQGILPPINPYGGVYVFNGGLIRCFLDYYIMGARCIISQYAPYLSHSELPTMWGESGVKIATLTGINDGSNWNTFFDSSLVMLVKIVDFTLQPVILAADLIHNENRGEDPRIYKKSDCKYYLGVVSVHHECDLGDKKGFCAYMSEFPITVNTENSGSYSIKIETGKRKKICRDVLKDQELPLFSKNLSPWTYAGVDYITDFKPNYTVYRFKHTETCRPLKVSDDVFYKDFKKLYSFKTNTIHDNDFMTLNLVDIAGTTPSIAVDKDVIEQYFPDYIGRLYCGVAHVRIKIRSFIEDRMYDYMINKLKGTGRKLNIPDLYEHAKFKKDNGNAYLHDDAYLMMLYFFDPDVDSDDNRGNIIYVSDIFYPNSFTIHNEASNFILVFPTGLVFNKDQIIISYGEGDVFQRVFVTKFSNFKFHNARDYNNVKIDFMNGILYGKEYQPKEEILLRDAAIKYEFKTQPS